MAKPTLVDVMAKQGRREIRYDVEVKSVPPLSSRRRASYPWSLASHLPPCEPPYAPALAEEALSVGEGLYKTNVSNMRFQPRTGSKVKYIRIDALRLDNHVEGYCNWVIETVTPPHW